MNVKWKDCVRAIWKSRNRFLSILCIVAIGVGFFAGIKASGPDMAKSADAYADEQNLMHFRLLSTWGFDQEDIEALEEIPDAEIRPSYFLDTLATSENGENAARVYAYQPREKINELWLTEGTWPRVSTECLVEASSEISIGSTVEFIGDGTGKSDLKDSLKTTTYTVVGKVRSAMYISDIEKGNTNIGGGRISQIFYIPYKNFLSDYYTEVYVAFEDMVELLAYSEEYKALEERHREDLEVMSEELAALRYERTVQSAQDEIDAAQEEVDEGRKALKEAREELDKAKKTAEDGEAQIQSGEEEIQEGELEIAENEQLIMENEELLHQKETELNSAKEEIASAESAYKDGLEEYNAAKAEAEGKLAEAEAQLNEARQTLDEAKGALETAEGQYAQVKELFDSIVSAAEEQITIEEGKVEEARSAYETSKAEYEKLLAELGPDAEEVKAKKEETDRMEQELIIRESLLEQAVNVYNEQRTNAERLLADAEEQLSSSRQEYEEGERQYESGLKQYEMERDSALHQLAEAENQLNSAAQQIADGKTQIADGEWQIYNGYAQLGSAKDQLAEGRDELTSAREKLKEAKKELSEGNQEIAENEKLLADAEAELAEAEEKIADARLELADMEAPVWYINDRDDNAGYEEYGQNSERINNIAKVFPVFFILVAALVCLTTMTRMIEEERTQIGTMKALGYGNGAILWKYMAYALSATLIGSVLGLVVGYQLFPNVIISAYGIMYSIGVKRTPFLWFDGVVIILISVGAVALVVYLCCRNVLDPMPAQLMRPKSPKKGKRVILEYIPWLWKHLSFSKKVTARNLFRYKKRMIMTIIGIMGCTGLSLTGFGVKDSINDIIANQFEKIWQYGSTIVVDGLTQEDEEEILNILRTYDNNASQMLSMQKSYTIKGSGGDMSAYVMVAETSEKLSEFIALENRITHEVFTLKEDGVIVTEKLATTLKLQVGDRVRIGIDDTRTVETTVQGIVENYAQHYVYMLPETYESLMGEAVEYNMLLGKYEGVSDEDEYRMASEIMKNEHVMTIQLQQDIEKTFSQMLKALDLVVVVLILSAALLAFVVLYNLANVNIAERLREIATLEVLGFNDKEVSQYVFRESVILTLIGTVIGLIFGRALTGFVIQTAEIDMVMFGREVKVWSYVWAAALTLLFSSIVNRFMHRPLRKISMVESLKSVE